MNRIVIALAATLILATSALAGRLADGALTVDGKPFFPLGSWNSSYTTPEDIDRLGMNTSFRGGPGSDEAVEAFRPFMRRCAELGIQVVPYLSYGGAGVTPWAPERVRSIAKLASEPNLLAWYVGDDITMKHLHGIRQTVSILREETPDLATVADYIAEETPEAQTAFTEYVDIRCQYNYPIPGDSIKNYMGFFDRQRAFVGDPLWTWVQNFMWGGTGRTYDLGIQDGPGPLPEPEQVRLLAFAAINRGVRGLFFFPHHELHLQPELAAEVAMTCREIRLFNDELAAGEITMNLAASDSAINAASFDYEGTTVVSTMIVRDTYHRWMDEAIARDFTIDVPWTGDELPTATLVATPDTAPLGVSAGGTPGTVRVSVPRLEIAGFILLTTDKRKTELLPGRVAAIAPKVAPLAVLGAAAQARKVGALIWRTGFDHLYKHPTMLLDAMRANEYAADMLVEGNHVEVLRAWRISLAACRVAIDTLMGFAQEREYIIPDRDLRNLHVAYGLPRIPNLVNAPAPDDPWNYVRGWQVTGPFLLEGNDDGEVVAPGFVNAFGPETEMATGFTSGYETLDGQAGWASARADISGRINFLHHFRTTEDAVCYARCTVTAPEDMDVDMSLGSNDGARAWLNGEEVFSWYGGRTAEPHQNTIPVRLREGENDVLVKVVNLGSNWALFLSFKDPDRRLVLGQ